MNVAELFVNLGIKGSDKTIGAIATTKQGLKDTASISLEAKAGILAAMYALERLFATSGKAGTDLTNFNATVGASVQTLQKYQYAARQVGVSNQAVEGSFRALQVAMTKTLMGEGAPKGLARVAQLTGTIGADDLKKFADNPELLIQRLQEYAKRETNKGLRNEVIKSFGIGEDMAAALSRGAFKPEVLQKAPTYSDKEINKLDQANIAWSNLGNKIEMAVGHFNAKHGGELVGDISKITEKVLKLAEAFMKFSEAIKLFDLIGKSFEGWGIILDGLVVAVNSVKDTFEDLDIFSGTKQEKLEQPDFTNDKTPNVFHPVLKDLFGSNPKAEEKIPVQKTEKEMPEAPESGIPVKMAPTEKENAPPLSPVGSGGMIDVSKLNSMFAAKEQVAPPKLKLVVPPSPMLPTSKSVLPPVPPSAAGAGGPMQNIEVNQNLNFNHDGTDVKRTGDSVKKSVKDAFRQMSAQGQGS